MMATYFHGGSEIQENLQTFYLMNPNYSYIAAYSDAHNSHPQSNMLLVNPSAPPSALVQGSIPHAPPHHQPPQPFIAIPLSHDNTPGRPSSSSTSPPHPHRHHHDHNLWSSAQEPSPARGRSAQVLSLSLSPQQQNTGMSVMVASGALGVMMGSKYLKAAQELLDEVVSVGYDKGKLNSGVHDDKAKGVATASEAAAAYDGGDAGESSGGSKMTADQLSPAQRQELQMKKAKLLNMLHEVEQRYKQYLTQMQAVVSSFEQATGMGSAKSYTSLALKTISRQFRCLKDAITSQIKATNKSLGEDHQDGFKPEGGGVGSRLRLVDHQLRQQRALQQFGMMPHNAWRPQRGLPERAVSVLRAWLFEHFLHPYPKDSDKHMLAKQTGLTRSQVSNWFINARVRLWKPMVEEMYSEEMKAQEHNTDNPDNNNANNGSAADQRDHNKDQQLTSKPTAVAQQLEQQQQHDHGGRPGLNQAHQQPDPQRATEMIPSDMESLIGATRNPKKQRTNNNGSDMHSSPSSILSMDMEMKPQDHETQGPGGPGFNQVYMVNDISGRFNPDHLAGPYANNGVSLTLGLPRCENLSSLSGSRGHHEQGFLPNQGMQLGRRVDVGAEEADFWGASMGHSSHPASNSGFESIDIQSRKRFAAHQLLHDFVA